MLTLSLHEAELPVLCLSDFTLVYVSFLLKFQRAEVYLENCVDATVM